MRLFKRKPIEEQIPARYYEVVIEGSKRWVDLFSEKVVYPPENLVYLKDEDLRTDWNQTLFLRSVGLLALLKRHSCLEFRAIDLTKIQSQLRSDILGKRFVLLRLNLLRSNQFLSTRLWKLSFGIVTLCVLSVGVLKASKSLVASKRGAVK